jgi:hypothetical protein
MSQVPALPLIIFQNILDCISNNKTALAEKYTKYSSMKGPPFLNIIGDIANAKQSKPQIKANMITTSKNVYHPELLSSTLRTIKKVSPKVNN